MRHIVARERGRLAWVGDRITFAAVQFLAPSSDSSLRWLVRLGWIAVLGQTATVAFVRYGLGVPLPMVELALVIACAVALNVATAAVARRPRADAGRVIGVVLVLETMLLTSLLWLTGGPSNPFSVLYLTHVTLAAVTTTARWTWSVVAVSIVAYGALFFTHRLVPDELGAHGAHAHAAHVAHDHLEAFSAHLHGMFVALALTAILIAWFVGRVTRALGEERERSARAARLVGLTTLAAGAAHELATPLATIKVATGELERALAARADLAEMLDDVRLIRREVERSRSVLDRLAARSGENAGEPIERSTVEALASAVEAELGSRAERVEVRAHGEDLSVPIRGLARALANLVDNALDASPPLDRVELVLESSSSAMRAEIHDRGEGMTDAVRARVGEPFFTTKPAGRGMGLGVFLARALAEQLGGTLDHRARPGGGTSTVMVLPLPRGRS